MGEVTVQSHNVGVTSFRLKSLSFHVNQPSYSWDTAFSKFDLENQGSRSWVRSQFSHNVGLTSYRLTSLLFHVNRASHSWVMTFSKFDLDNQRSRSWVRSQFKVTMWVLHSIDSHPFRSMSIGPPILEIQHFQNLTLKIKGQGHGWGHSSKSQCGSNILSTHIPFIPCQSALPFLRYSTFTKLDLENQGSRSNDPDVAQIQI